MILTLFEDEELIIDKPQGAVYQKICGFRLKDI
jgi:hypothetical protein